MDYRELREVMKFLHCKGLLAKDIYADMLDTLGDSAPSYAMVKKWVTEFKKGRISEDFVRGSGRPRDVSTYENVDFIRNLVKEDERVTVQDIAKYVGISFGSVHTILSKLLELVKVSGRWVPRRVSNERKMTRLEFCKEYLAWHRVNPSRLVQQTVIDHAWIYHFERTDILFQPPEQTDPDNGDEPTESKILNKALTCEKPPTIPDINAEGAESSTNNVKGESKHDLGNSVDESKQDTPDGSVEVRADENGPGQVKSEPEEPKTDVENVVGKPQLETIIRSTEYDIVTESKPKSEVTEPDPVEKPLKDDKCDLIETSDLKVEGANGKVDTSNKNGVTTSDVDLPRKKFDTGGSKVTIDVVKVTNGAASSNPNMLAILGQKPVNGVPRLVPLMGPHGFTLGAGFTAINVAQLAALTGISPANLAQLAGNPPIASNQLKENVGQKRPSSDASVLPKKKQRKERPPTETSCIFWDSEGVIYVETLEPGQNLTGDLYCDMLLRLKDSMDKKRPGALDSGVLLLEDQAPAGAKPPRGVQLLPVPFNSPDLSPSDFHIFPKVKEYLRSSRLSSRLNAAIESFIVAQDDSYFKSALTEMERRCIMCVDLNGDYAEK